MADALYDAVHDAAAAHFRSFYSSALGGIVTDAAFMALPVDDHLVHRGHGVFDTAIVIGGYIYQLDDHLARLLRSAAAARIPLPMSRAHLRRILLDVAAASRCKNGFLRYWLSAGRGNFSLSGNATLQPEFYAIFYDGPRVELDPTVGWKVKTSPIPNKPGLFSELKSVNYLQNALNVMDAEDDGCEHGIFVGKDGTVYEGPNLNVGIVTEDGIVRTPSFEGCLAGITMRRLVELVPENARENNLEGIHFVQQGRVTLEDVAAAKEAFVTGGSVPVAAVTHWDGQLIGDGTVGTQVLALRQMIIDDMRPRQDSDQHTEVPYGMLTGMLEDM